jgi:uncharacterized membrane protein
VKALAAPDRSSTTPKQLPFAGAVGHALLRHWFPIAFAFVSLYAGLPWVAPVFMRLGWTAPGQAIYGLYSTQCHQMAQRSYFLFGPKFMYSPAELQAAGAALDPLSLRAFVGTPELGWKVAFSDRMASMYGGLSASMLGVRLLRRRLPPLPLWGLVLLILPLALDGTTHFISDLSGFGRGFRDSNLWLAALTSGRLASGFYAGDAWGSFNAAMRLFTGGLFGLAVAWYALPRVQAALDDDGTGTPAPGPRPGAAP